jgi:hypothetical protein
MSWFISLVLSIKPAYRRGHGKPKHCAETGILAISKNFFQALL